MDCAMAGRATADVPAARLAACKNCRRFICVPQWIVATESSTALGAMLGGGAVAHFLQLQGLDLIRPRSARNVYVKLHLRMDAAEHQEGARARERDLHGLARFLRTGVEIEGAVEDSHIVGARVVVDDPQPFAAAERDML